MAAAAPYIPMIAGTLMNLISGMTGKNAQSGSTFNPQQLSKLQEILGSLGGSPNIQNNQNYQQGQDWLSNLFGNDQGFWDKFEAPLQRQFNEETAPGIANRFASMGSGGALGSTAFRNQLGREASNLSTNIGALRGGMQSQGVGQALQYGQQPMSNYMGMLNQVLQPTQNTWQPAQPGIFGNTGNYLIGGGLNQGFGQGFGGMQ